MNNIEIVEKAVAISRAIGKEYWDAYQNPDAPAKDKETWYWMSVASKRISDTLENQLRDIT